jgi:radical SAM superfamily enzyme YgiQ (UPF0313 family)
MRVIVDEAVTFCEGEATMKAGLIAYNWEADTSLALWNLVTYAQQSTIIRESVEFAQHCAATPKSPSAQENELFRLLRWVRDGGFDVIGFSCYIWNIQFVNRAAQAIKELWPHIRIVYGGQQIRGFYVRQVFERERCVDICVINEAELTFQRLLLNLLLGDPPLSKIGGLAYFAASDNKDKALTFTGREASIPPGCEFIETGDPDIVEDINNIPSPYLGRQELPIGGAFLYEASRGCPYRCSFCIWGESKEVREYPMDRVEAEIRNILLHRPSHIMFCDGTFNMRKERARQILSILVDHLQERRVDPFSLLLELKLEIIDDSLVRVMDELVRLNPLVTIEFGLQSATQEAAKLMRRPFNEDRFRNAWNRLTPKLKSSAIVDCIYGLPGDGIEQFKATVDFCYSLAPHRIQCFRLSILPGSQFERQAVEFNIRFAREPNHMVYETAWVDLDAMTWLESFGFAVADLYHFHGNTIKCILGLDGEEMKFSELITQFVAWSGRDDIVGSSYAGNRPEGRWRAINLTQLFERFVFEVVLPVRAVDRDVLLRFRDLICYEAMLGKMAVRGLDTGQDVHPSAKAGQSSASSRMAVRAEVLRSNYDIPQFVIATRGKTKVDIRDLVETESYIAVTERAGHQDVRVPMSYRISKKMAHILQRARDCDPMEDARGVDSGLVRKLQLAGLLVEAA